MGVLGVWFVVWRLLRLCLVIVVVWVAGVLWRGCFIVGLFIGEQIWLSLIARVLRVGLRLL